MPASPMLPEDRHDGTVVCGRSRVPAGPALPHAGRRRPATHPEAGVPAYLATPSVAEGPTFSASHVLSGRVARRRPVTRSMAAAVASQPSTGHSFQATIPL